MRSPSRMLMGGVLAVSIIGTGIALVAVPPGTVVLAPPDAAPAPLEINLEAAWVLHQIVEGASGAGQPDGADGVDLRDINGDSRLDVVAGHEQGLRLTVSLNPGPSGVEDPWPTVILPTVNMCSVEDAIFCDVDADGAQDVVAVCETGTFRAEVMFAPTPPNSDAELLNAANWTRVTLNNSANRRSMRAACADVAGDDSLELVVGEKDAGIASAIGYYSSETPRTGSSWTHTVIAPVGWVMQLYVQDFDGDSDLDIVYSDRDDIITPALDQTKKGVRVLLGDGADPPAFTPVQVTPTGQGQWKWFDLADWDEDDDLDVIACRSEPPSLRTQTIYLNGGGGLTWSSTVSVPTPTGIGFCQHITAVDLNEDGLLDIGSTYFDATNLSGVLWQKRAGTSLSPSFERGEIAGILDVDSDTKFDNVVWADIDGDSDLDAVTTEQHVPAGTGPGLGVVYLENPGVAFVAPPVTEVECSLLTAGTSTTDATSIASASINPGANRWLAAGVMTTSSVANQRIPTASGAGATWVQVDDEAFTTVSTYRRLTVFRSMTASPSTGAVTFDYGAGGNLSSWSWAIVECEGADTSGTDGSGATAQSDVATVAAGTALATSLAALDSSDSAHVCFTAQSINSATAVAPDADFVELSELGVANGSGSLAVAWANDQTDCSTTFAAADAAQLSIEVRAQ